MNLRQALLRDGGGSSSETWRYPTFQISFFCALPAKCEKRSREGVEALWLAGCLVKKVLWLGSTHLHNGFSNPLRQRPTKFWVGGRTGKKSVTTILVKRIPISKPQNQQEGLRQLSFGSLDVHGRPWWLRERRANSRSADKDRKCPGQRLSGC